jgi:hypothetical protein
MGRTWNNLAGGEFNCIDIRTGEILYKPTGSITLAQTLRAATRDPTRGTPESQGVAPVLSLWGISSSSWKRYDPFSGTLLQTITNVPTGIQAYNFREGDPVVYCIRQLGWNTTIPNRLATNELIKWDYEQVTGNNWMTGIVWNVSMKQPDGTGPGEGERTSSFLIYGDRAIVTTYNEDNAYVYNLETGQQIMVKNFGFANTYSPSWSEKGVLISYDSVYRQLLAYDFQTLNELWVSEPLSYPWGSDLRYPTWAYGNFYVAAYDGYVYCFNEDTGVLKWKFYCGNTTETVFGSYVPYLGQAGLRPVIADGKVYIGTSEHTPTQPRIRFNRLYCIDAYNGNEVWNISGAISPACLAEGYFIGVSENDGIQYCFGKGQTETTISAPDTAVSKGNAVVIKGTIMDMSPAQSNTPAIADEDMSAWMNYIHMQKPQPMGPEGFTPNQSVDITGVPVMLTATAPDCSTISIGEVTSDGYGYFMKSWTPPNTGDYKIQATFTGSNSYWSSTAETGVTVTSSSTSPSASLPSSQSPSSTASPSSAASPSASASASESASPSVAPPPSTESAPSMTLYIAIAVAVVIVAVAAAVLFLKRK